MKKESTLKRRLKINAFGVLMGLVALAVPLFNGYFRPRDFCFLVSFYLMGCAMGSVMLGYKGFGPSVSYRVEEHEEK